MEIRRISPEETWSLRQAVLWPDKDISCIKIAADHQGVHYGLCVDERLVSVVSAFYDRSAREMQFRKFATLQAEQGKGYGSALLSHLLTTAKEQGVRLIWCNARKSKTAFYRKFGLQENGPYLVKDGMEFVMMSWKLEEEEEVSQLCRLESDQSASSAESGKK